MSELELFRKIFEGGLFEDKIINELFDMLEDADNIDDFKGFIEKCRKHKTVEEFRDCVIAKIKKVQVLSEANAQKHKEEQEEKTLLVPKTSHKPKGWKK